MADDESQTNWLDILGAPDDGLPWIRLSPERVALLALEDCTYQLEHSLSDVDRLAMAAKAAHLALQAALTAALAGSANIGAHPEKLRSKYLEYFENSRSAPLTPPANDRVMAFPELLAAATGGALPWTGSSLQINEAERSLLGRLTAVRHAVEHPKQSHHSIEPAYVAEALPIAARLIFELLTSVSHHFTIDELDNAKMLISSISEMSLFHASENN